MSLRDMEVSQSGSTSVPISFDYPATIVEGDLLVAHVGWAALNDGTQPDTPSGWTHVMTDDSPSPESSITILVGVGGGGAYTGYLITFIKTADGTETGSVTVDWPGSSTPYGFQSGMAICGAYSENPGLDWAIRQDLHNDVDHSAGVHYDFEWEGFTNPILPFPADVISILLLKPCTNFWSGFSFNDETSHDAHLYLNSDNQTFAVEQGYTTVIGNFEDQAGDGTTQAFLSLAGWNAARMYPVSGGVAPAVPGNDWTPPKRRRRVSPQAMPHRLTSMWLRAAGEGHRE